MNSKTVSANRDLYNIIFTKVFTLRKMIILELGAGITELCIAAEGSLGNRQLRPQHCLYNVEENKD